MSSYKADERGPGDLLLDPSEKGIKARAAHAASKRMILETVCVECGLWGTYGTGGLLYCGEHAPHDTVNAAAAFQRRQEAAREK